MMQKQTMSPLSAPWAEVVIESPLWDALPDAARIVRDSLAAAAAELGPGDGEVAVALTDDAAIRGLNAAWRGMDKPTNVLSFPAPAFAAGPDAPGPHLGDIAIAFETAVREAEAEGKLLAHHLAHLAVHGYLHLLGHDHDASDQAEAMERLESAILARLDVPDPYAADSAEALSDHA